MEETNLDETLEEKEQDNPNMFSSVVIRPVKALFLKDGNDFKIYSCEVVSSEKKLKVNSYGTISVKGEMPKLELYENTLVDLIYDNDERYNNSYSLMAVKYSIPEEGKAQQVFLKSLITDIQFNNIYDTYNSDDKVIDMIMDGTILKRNIKGIKHVTIENIKQKIDEKLEMNGLITFLSPYGVSMKMIERIHKKYTDSNIAIEKIKENPYNLLSVRGIGFLKADEIALNMGMDMGSETRVLSSFSYILEENVFKQGDTYMDLSRLIKEASSLLMISKKVILSYVEKEKLKQYGIYLDENIVTTTAMYISEMFVADKILQSQINISELLPVEYIESFINEYEKDNGVQLAKEQREFLFNCNKSRVSFLIGGGGMGKTWLMQLFTLMLKSFGKTARVLAPTGKASKVISNYIGMEASTIHRALRIVEDGEAYALPPEDFEEEVIIVDEVSMCDIRLMCQLLQSVNFGQSRIIFIGDDYQLASVGAGNFLYDCINSDVVNVTRLTKVYRQKEGGVSTVANDIRNDRNIIPNGESGRIKFGHDLVMYLSESEDIEEMLISTYCNILKQGNTVDDIMILSPTSKGKLGTKNINKVIQNIVNPSTQGQDEIVVGGSKDEASGVTYRVADRVINLDNNYNIPVVDENFECIESNNPESTDGLMRTQIFNGETGIIKNIDIANDKFHVDFNGEIVQFEMEALGSGVVHSYCITIHKSQGSQAKFVICVFDKSSTFQLNANLIYTGITRTQTACCVFTQPLTFKRGIKKFNNMQRKTLLGQMLKDSPSI